MSFAVSKRNAFIKSDKSKQGSIDSGIVKLVRLINARPEFFTTSSCAGRTVLINLYGQRKNQAKWLFKSHGLVKPSEISSAIPERIKGAVWLKYEPFIMHVHCSSIDAANALLRIALAAGMKKSGIIAASSDFVVELEGSDRLETIVFNKKQLVDKDYILELTNEINKKVRLNKKKVRRFKKLLISLWRPAQSQ